ncbi:MAG TPA: glucose-1-phosphate adenylyltransferase [Anaerolineales bacterium]|nr:glucose-1-phosphate adenylyltransferase [Anaerolineales bacterium]HNQ95369.1 glucose-1-phosphate adenylyltransferase [Anaerolineales bacterium]HNS62567.1 glucose-1-phosphate adenylyltransferase [Anaerolineales bacterium]
MKTRAVILAGGEGSRLGALTVKRTKPAVPFAGKYRIIDFALSNCVNSGIFDLMVLAQYRPQSLIEHIGVGAPWDLNRDFTGGIKILTPYKARNESDWYVGTADAVQQNFGFIKQGSPDLVLILSGDHIYTMDYEPMISFHLDHEADLTMGVITVPMEEASRFGILATDDKYRVTSFVEKPKEPPSNLANMGVYLFRREVLDKALWEDRQRKGSSHDFGKDILPRLIKSKTRVFAYPYSGYWMDVGTLASYWQAHMDLLAPSPRLKLYNRSWIIHTRTAERPPARFPAKGSVYASMICDGCFIEEGATVESSVLSPGVIVRSGAVVRESIVLTDAEIKPGAVVERSVLDKQARVEEHARVGWGVTDQNIRIALVGKNSVVPSGYVIEPEAEIGTDVIQSDYPDSTIRAGQVIQTKRQPNEI